MTTLFASAASLARLAAAGYERVHPGRGLRDHWTRNGRLLSTAAALRELDRDEDHAPDDEEAG